MKTAPDSREKQPLAEGRYKCGCSRYALLNELPQLCPVHRQEQTELAVISGVEERPQSLAGARRA